MNGFWCVARRVYGSFGLSRKVVVGFLVMVSLFGPRAEACALAQMPVLYQDGDMGVGVNIGPCDAVSSGGRSVCPMPEGAALEVVVAVASPDTALREDVLARVAAVSQYRSIRYWSDTRERWRELVSEAHALTGSEGVERDDLQVKDLFEGAEFYFAQKENTPAGDVVYRTSVRVNQPDRLVLDVSNALPVRVLGLTFFAPGDYVFHHDFRRMANSTWSYDGTLSIRGCGNFYLRNKAISFASRMAALASYLLGRSPVTPPVRIH
ncbi:MAG: hypothetical protein HQL37_01115 [Alphaproteobacteria bacterium]|nr:hypothetical protein [Alphaproteobacteria bacterium]